MSRGKRSYFEMIEGEGILRVWDENTANRKKLTFKMKKGKGKRKANGNMRFEIQR